jgi:MFS family permease
MSGEQTTASSTAPRPPSPPWSVASIVVSMSLLAIGNGLLFTYVPVKLAADGFPPWVAGAILTAMSAGGIVGCFVTGLLVRRVGHARVFAALTALVILTILAISLGTDPYVWVAARGAYGVAMTGVFIVAQSWLNDASENAWRGRVIAIFYTAYVVGIGVGSNLLAYVSVDGPDGPLLALFFVTLGILPVSLTRLSTPPPPETIKIAVASVWRISPVGFAGLSVVGGLTMLVAGFAPIYATASGFGQADVATMMLLMQVGMIVVQFPLGALSDRIDRRIVLIVACVIVVAASVSGTQMAGASLAGLIVLFALWSGGTETIYSVANAHANDRAEPRYYVSLSSTLLVAWSVSGTVLPGVTTLLTPVVGPQAFMYVTIVTAALYGVFVLYRLTRREPVPDEDQEPFQQMTAQMPLTAELAPVPVPVPAEDDAPPAGPR